MKDNEIIRLLGHIVTLYAKDALDLINRQKAEIERLQAMVDAELDTIHKLGDDYERALEEEQELVKKARAEAIKEFADMVDYFALHEDPEINFNCKDYESYMGGFNQFRLQIVKGIDNLVKEMVGDAE